MTREQTREEFLSQVARRLIVAAAGTNKRLDRCVVGFA
jgi:hypothetical protein